MIPKRITTRNQVATRAELYRKATSTYPTFPATIAADFKQLTIRTQAWLELAYTDGSKGWVPIKFCAYDCTIEEYSKYRKKLDSAKAVELVTKWGSDAPKGHPAFQRVRDFCEAHGLAYRSDFRVILMQGTFASPIKETHDDQPKSKMEEETKDRLIADFICNALPGLCEAQRMRVIELAASL